MTGPVGISIGPSSGGGGSANANVKSVTAGFAYNSGPTVAVLPIVSSEILLSCRILIDAAFDGTALISLGDSVTPELFMKRVDVDPYLVGAYQAWPDYLFPTSETITLFLQITGASQGSGRIVIEVQTNG